MKWLKLNSIKQIRFVRSIFGSGIRSVYDVVLPFSSTRKACQSATTPPTSKAGGKKTPALMKIISAVYATAAMLISRLIRTSITISRSPGWGKRKLMRLFSLLISTAKKTVKAGTNSTVKNSKKISALDKLYAYASLIILSGITLYYLRTWYSIIIVFLTARLITAVW